jgi:hypothetical protein
MRFASYDRFAVSPWRIVGVGVAASFAASLAMGLLFGDALGEAETPALLVLGVLVFYIVISIITLGSGFVLHELAHKYFAIKYGARARFQASSRRPSSSV